VAEEIRKGKRKGKKEKMKIVVDLGTTIDWTTQRVVEKFFKTKFVATWILIVVKESCDKFHHNFQASLWADPHRYIGMNLDRQ
jgi:hypothetical protein